MQNNGKIFPKFCTIIESNSQKTCFAIVLYINMAAVTSLEKRESTPFNRHMLHNQGEVIYFLTLLHRSKIILILPLIIECLRSSMKTYLKGSRLLLRRNKPSFNFPVYTTGKSLLSAAFSNGEDVNKPFLTSSIGNIRFCLPDLQSQLYQLLSPYPLE